MNTIDLKDTTAAYLDQGQGPPVILVHCANASHKMWRGLTASLTANRRVLAPDLLGYGHSSPWPSAGPPPRDTDIDIVERLIQEAGEPVDLVGHSFGGAVCLEAARLNANRKSANIRSLTLIEPVSFHLLRAGVAPRDWARIVRIGRAVIAATDAGRPAEAANAYMGFWLGPLQWRLAPARFRRSVKASIAKVAHDFRTMFDYQPTAIDYGAIRCPVTLVRGARTRRPAATVIDILADALSLSTRRLIPGAGHMSPFTHPAAVQDIVHEVLDHPDPSALERAALERAALEAAALELAA